MYKQSTVNGYKLDFKLSLWTEIARVVIIVLVFLLYWLKDKEFVAVSRSPPQKLNKLIMIIIILLFAMLSSKSFHLGSEF